MASATDIVKATVQSNTVLRDAVPTGAGATLQSMGGAILAYTPYMNEFVNTLINRVLFQEVHNLTFNNPLKIFKGADVPFGTDVQDSIANPAIATPYDATAMSDILTPQNPDIKTVYYRRNRQDKYKVTIYDEVLKGAFVSEDAFSNFVAMIMNTLTSGDNIDEFELMKGVVSKALDEGNIHSTTIAMSGDHEAFAKSLVTDARAKYLQFQFPSTNFNQYLKMATEQGVENPTALKTWTSPDRISIMIRADVAAYTDVEVLAKAFNMDKATFMGRQVIVDSFGDGETSSKTLAIIMDNTALRTHDNRFLMADTAYNAATLSRTYYLHHWETIAYSPFANAWAFVEG